MIVGFNLTHITSKSFYQGENLGNVLADIQKYLSFVQKTKNQLMVEVLCGFQLAVLNLMGQTPSALSFDTVELKESQYLENCQAHQSFGAICMYNVLKSQILYLYGQFAEAKQATMTAEQFIMGLAGDNQYAEHCFYHALILLACYPETSAEEQPKSWEKITANQKQMRIWADNCPENYEHKYLLITAEMARLEGKNLEAMDLYDQAIDSAKANEFIQCEALANELASKFYLAWGREKFAKAYRTEAHYKYMQWGATTKVKDLEQKYARLISHDEAQPRTIERLLTITATPSNTTVGDVLDLSTILRASQAISGEIKLESLLSKMMTVIIENAGARRGLLILDQNGQWVVEAEGAIDKADVTVLQSLPLEGLLPETMINYVARTRANIVLNDATKEGQFTQDKYIVNCQPKSVLCVPLIHQGKLNGLLYLENRLTSSAFTPERLEVLQLLSAQASISIENARLYNTLEQKVFERTAQLAEANEEITVLNERLKVENIRLGAEVAVARKLQLMLLPSPQELHHINGLDIAGFMEPADEVGGDYYDVLQRAERVKIAIGDVTGHGLESGVLMLMTQTAIRTLLNSDEIDSSRFLNILNQTIYDNVRRIGTDKNLTLVILDYTPMPTGGRVRLSGQHEEVIVIRQDGKIEWIETDNLGFPIGLNNNIADFVGELSIELQVGDGVVLYTDGITESTNKAGEQYGLPRLGEVISQNWSQTAEQIKTAVVTSVRQFINEQKVDDDLTLVVIKQK